MQKVIISSNKIFVLVCINKKLLKIYIHFCKITLQYLLTSFFSILFKMSQFDRSELVSLAEKCYENGCHEDVIRYMKEVIKMATILYNTKIFILPFIFCTFSVHGLHDLIA